MQQNQPIFSKGLNIDGFRLVNLIGSGGTAEVWEAEDANLNRWAIKIFSPGSAMDEINLKLFRKQFSLTERLDHPNILRGKKYGVHNNRPYIIFDLCDTSLMKLLKERLYAKMTLRNDQPPFREEEIADIIKQVTDALAYLHSKEVVHQDIKPDNILIKQGRDDDENTYVISDFGVSTELKMTILRDSDILKENNKGLTPNYAAPELYQGEVFKATDIFALGITIYELCTGRPPISNTSMTPAIALIHNPNYIIPDLPDQYSQRLNCLVKSCIKLEPSERPEASVISGWADFYTREGYWPEDICKKPAPPITDRFSGKWVKYAAVSVALILSVVAATKLVVPYFRDPIGKFEKAIHNVDFVKATELYTNPEVKAKFPQYNYLTGEVTLKRTDEVKGKNYHTLQNNQTQKWGVVDQELKLMIPFEYDGVLKIYTDDVVTVKKGSVCMQVTIENQPLKNPGRCTTYKSVRELGLSR